MLHQACALSPQQLATLGNFRHVDQELDHLWHGRGRRFQQGGLHRLHCLVVQLLELGCLCCKLAAGLGQDLQDLGMQLAEAEDCDCCVVQRALGDVAPGPRQLRAVAVLGLAQLGRHLGGDLGHLSGHLRDGGGGQNVLDQCPTQGG